jgi:hypothetical protein
MEIFSRSFPLNFGAGKGRRVTKTKKGVNNRQIGSAGIEKTGIGSGITGGIANTVKGCEKRCGIVR